MDTGIIELNAGHSKLQRIHLSKLSFINGATELSNRKSDPPLLGLLCAAWVELTGVKHTDRD